MPFVQPRHGARTLSLRGAGVEYLTVTSSASLNTKGAWVELTAALAVACRAFTVVLLGAETGVWYLVDVGIGAAGAEQVIAPNLQMQTFNDFGNESRSYTLPYALAAGTRIALRCQASASSKGVRAALLAHAGGAQEAHPGVQRIAAFGHNLTTTQGTQVDPGGTANTKGAWAQMTAATATALRRLLLAVAPPTNVVFCSWTVDIGIGAAGSEVVVVPDVPFHAADIGKSIGPCAPAFDVSLPAGVRLALRAQCDSNNATGRLLHAVLHGAG